jgi:hypothetical protein
MTEKGICFMEAKEKTEHHSGKDKKTWTSKKRESGAAELP